MRFALGAYDRRLPLVIDPVLVLSTYLGGPNSDQPGGIAVGPDVSVTIVGWDGLDVVLHRISATGTLMWSTRLGGSGFEAGQDVAVDAQGNVYVTGSTFSPNFPVVGGVPGSTGTAFVTKLAPDGSTLVFSTRLGGSGTSRGNGIGVDASGGVVIAGFTTSTDFPVTAGAAQATPGGGVDCFVARLSPSGSQLVFATYLGGSGDDGYNFRQLNMLAVDAAGDAWAIGETRSTDFPTTPGAFQRNFGGGFLDAFVTRFSPTGSVQWSTYLGGSGEDAAFGIALGNDASAYVVGYTASVNFPVTPGAFDTVPAPCCFGDGFLVRLDSSGSQLAFGTFLGGTSATGLSVDVDSRGRAYVTGRAPFFDLPLVDPVQTTCASCTSGFSDAFAMTVAPPGSSLLLSTYLGGTGQDQGNATVADGSGFWVTGEAGASWPVTPGALQPFSGGGQDGFLVRLQFAAYTTHVILDVSGYFVASGDFFSLTPCRVVDTRLPAGVRGGPALTTWNDRSFPLVGGCGVPPEATAIAANIAVVPGAAGGHLRIFPAGSPVPLTAAITYNAGQTRSNNAILPLGADGITVRSVESP